MKASTRLSSAISADQRWIYLDSLDQVEVGGTLLMTRKPEVRHTDDGIEETYGTEVLRVESLHGDHAVVGVRGEDSEEYPAGAPVLVLERVLVASA